MAHPFHHALSSVRKWGGATTDYQPIHDWFDATKAHLPDARHRAARHHSEGIFLAEQLFGTTILNSDGRPIPVRWIGEQHVREDLGRIPTLADWLREIRPRPWMGPTLTLEEPSTSNESSPSPSSPPACSSSSGPR